MTTRLTTPFKFDIDTERYLNCSTKGHELLAALQADTMTTIYQQFCLLRTLIPVGESRSYGDYDHTITVYANGLCVRDHSAGWEAILVQFDHLEYDPTVDGYRWFYVYAGTTCTDMSGEPPRIAQKLIAARSILEKPVATWKDESTFSEIISSMASPYMAVKITETKEKPKRRLHMTQYAFDLQLPLIFNMANSIEHIQACNAKE